MNKNLLTFDIICKVVDNYGDIGFVYRLARTLLECDSSLNLRLVVDDLHAFHSLCPGIDTDKQMQRLESMYVIRWDSPDSAVLSLYDTNPPEVVLECYSCGRPEWMNEYVFNKSYVHKRIILAVEYLSLEDWVPSFHCLSCLTNVSNVEKYFFMPGIEDGTGGLVLDYYFQSLLFLKDKKPIESSELLRRRLFEDPLFECMINGKQYNSSVIYKDGEIHSQIFKDLLNTKWFLFFTYEFDFSGIFSALSKISQNIHISVFSAAGRSQPLVRRAWEQTGQKCTLVELPIMKQQLWDTCMAASDLLFIRGEESFSRSLTLSRPLLWHCYQFSDDHGRKGAQMDKVYAFLKKIQNYLNHDDFFLYYDVMQEINIKNTISCERFYQICEKTFDKSCSFSDSFTKLSNDALKIGNFAENLLTFIHHLV